MIRLARLVLPCLVTSLIFPVIAHAAFEVGVSFNDPGAKYTSYYSPIIANLQAAGADWAAHIAGSGTIDVQINFDPALATSTGQSSTSGFISSDGNFSYFEQGAAYKIRTGIDLNGDAPDATLTLGTDYLANSLWFDTAPTNRSGALQAQSVDAYSVFLHEMGHILAFNGWLDPQTAAVTTSYLSPFDELVQTDGSNFFFTGAESMKLTGNPIPLTSGNLFHVGNLAPGPGSEFADDLMNGLQLKAGHRYGLSSLDLAMASDIGLSVIAPVPEPRSVILMSLGAALFAWKSLRPLKRRAVQQPG